MKLFSYIQRTGWALLVLLGLSLSARAQSVKDIRINEVLVFNADNYMDPYGHRVGWIELHNTSHASIDVGGCYLTVYPGGKEMYPIPKGDPRTIIPPEGYVIFYAEGTATKGVFHTNFTLDQTGYLALYDQSGRNVIDAVDYAIDEQLPDISIGFQRDEETGVVTAYALPATTPHASNEEQDAIPRSERFRMRDPYGVVMAITAMSVVFSALLLLYLIFRTIGKINTRSVRKKHAKEEQAKNQAIHPVMPDDSELIHGEELAAIALALYQYQNDLHDIESNVITINKVARAYSPWSSKIYGLRQLPPRNK
ncbi:MAG: OadG family protein [Rikenellaceae bacterium]|jgi:Na+-transporting methylmalonyl-CoA/oxaloacetate decarboxylase gamma subunit|nr:OadG family protein [Rikenellaceae bacterium]